MPKTLLRQSVFTLPQAARLVIPALGNEFSSLTKSAAALLAIGVAELTCAAKNVAAWGFRVTELQVFAAIIYLIWVAVIIKESDIMYEKVKIPRLEVSA